MSALRIIPAYAGSTPRVAGLGEGLGDHPRIRGEHPGRSRPPDGYGGSSPHTRGARELGLCVPGVSGIIPAYAGSTAPVSVTPVSRCGSSPHTRGAQPAGTVAVAEFGIIPAYAGSTSCRCDSTTSAGDHPRIRGEHSVRKAVGAAGAGSSPHTRGAPSHPSPRSAGPGIIPAYAGSTPTKARRA